MDTATWVFAPFGIATQLLLVAFFAARRWAPLRARSLGYLAYGAGLLGVPVAGWLLASGQSWRLWVGPLLFAAWAALGAGVDLWRKVEWREPLRMDVFAPYVALYFTTQMFLWWPLWDASRPAWAAFGVLFVVNTTLNLLGHFGHHKAVGAG